MLPDTAFRSAPILEGRFFRLEPLEERHSSDLAGAGQDPEVFRFLRYSPGGSEPAMLAHIRTLEARHRAGTDLPFAVVRRSDSRAVGMTRFLEIDRENSAVEIGGTWLDRTLWGSVANPESKRLMLGHAFDLEAVNRVQIKTDARNHRSQRAIEKLGAVREGVLRNHVIMPDGFLRSSVYYSVLHDEWPSVRVRLDERISSAAEPAAGPPRP
jgi:RimJ/RimL family protein N-acetyltransferase